MSEDRQGSYSRSESMTSQQAQTLHWHYPGRQRTHCAHLHRTEVPCTSHTLSTTFATMSLEKFDQKFDLSIAGRLLPLPELSNGGKQQAKLLSSLASCLQIQRRDDLITEGENSNEMALGANLYRGQLCPF